MPPSCLKARAVLAFRERATVPHRFLPALHPPGKGLHHKEQNLAQKLMEEKLASAGAYTRSLIEATQDPLPAMWKRKACTCRMKPPYP